MEQLPHFEQILRAKLPPSHHCFFTCAGQKLVDRIDSENILYSLLW